jgi:hypothetical protein
MRQIRLQPLLVGGSLPRLRYAIAILAEYDDRNARPSLLAQQCPDGSVSVDECRQRVRVQYQSLSSGSTASNSLSMTR